MATPRSHSVSRALSRAVAGDGRSLPIFPGDIGGPWVIIAGLVPMTIAVYLQSFIAPVKCCDYEKVSSSGATGITGSAYFVNGRLDTAAIIAACSLVSYGGTPSQYVGLYQLRVTKWYNQSTVSGAPAALLQADLTKAPTLGVVNGEAALFFGSAGASDLTEKNVLMECALSSPNQLSTLGGTSVVCCRPFNTRESGILTYHAESANAQGVALRADGKATASTPTKWSYWNTFFAEQPVSGTPGIVAIRKQTVSLMQAIGGGSTVEIGAGPYSTMQPSVSQSTFTTNGYTLGGYPGTGNFVGEIYGVLVAAATRTPAQTLTARKAMDAAFNVRAIDETVSIAIGGFSMLEGQRSNGIPQIQGTNRGTYSKAWAQGFADALSRNVRVAAYGAASGPDPWSELTSRIPGILDEYSPAAARNIHYCEFSSAIVGTTATDFITGLTSYLNSGSGFKAQAAAKSQIWEIVVGGLTPYQAANPTYTSVNAALIANAGSLGYTYNPPLLDTAYNAAAAVYGSDWIVLSHWSAPAHAIIGAAEGTNFNSILG